MSGGTAETETADAALLEQIRRDEPGAFERFVARYGDRIYGFGMRFCGEREDARDVAQETLLQAFRSVKRLDEPRALRSWLYRVAANACLMKRRRSKFAPRRELSLDELMPGSPAQATAEIPDVKDLPHDALERGEVAQSVRRAIAALPRHYRMVLVLRDMEQLSTEEVARVLGLKPGTVKMRLHRARLAVRRVLAQQDGPR